MCASSAECARGPGRIVVATILRPNGETGVQTHFNEVISGFTSLGVPISLHTPFDYTSTAVFPVFALRKLIDPLSGSLGVWWYRHWHHVFLREVLKRHLVSGDQVLIYAQCPVAAAAAVEARVSVRQQVVMMVHYNRSQADEWAGKGKITHGGPCYRRIKAFEGRILPQLDGIVYASEWMRQATEQDIPKVKAVPSAVIPYFIRPPRREPAEGCADLITIGTLEPRKNQSFLLRVVWEAKQAGHIYTLDVVGDGPCLPALKALAKALNIVDQVRFLGFRGNAAQLISGHRAYVQASIVESFCIVLIEALGAGIPAFAPAVGGIPEVFEDNSEGRYWPLDDAKLAAEILVKTLGDREAYGRMCSAARRRFLERCSVDVGAHKLLSFFGWHSGFVVGEKQAQAFSRKT